MTRYGTLWTLLMVAVSRALIGSFLALAAIHAPSPVQAATSAPAATAAEPKAEIDALIRALEDPAQRERLIAALKQQPGKTASAAKDEGFVESFGTTLLRQASATIAALGDWRRELRQSVDDPRGIVQRLGDAAQDPARRDVLIDLVLQVGLAVGAGLLASGGIGLIARGPRRRTTEWPQPSWPWRLSGSLVHVLADLAQIGALAAAGYVVITAIQFGETERLCALAVINAMILARVGCALARLLVAPMTPSLRLWRLQDETAAYLYVWLRRFIVIPVYGYFALQVALLLGLPAAVYGLGLRLLGLVLVALMIGFVLQNRRAVTALLAGGGAPDTPARWWAIRQQLARIWHILAIIYLVAAYIVWAAQLPGGFAFLAKASAVSAVILLLARGVVGVLRMGYRGLLRINHDLLERYPPLEQRANRYLPLLRQGVELVIWGVALLAVLDAWQLDLGWLLRSALIEQVMPRLIVVALMLIFAAFLWEATDAAITLYLQRTDPQGVLVVRSARARTLLPLVRNAVFVLISLLAGLTVLSQLGVNIGPLLAGAGVVGLAIGFGAQTLVKDVITGAFILFEDTMNVGDVANINGKGGQVEGMTIRTVRLRDVDGTVHTIPFSAITTISNMTKDYSYFVADIGIAYRNQTDRFIEVLKEVFAELKQDPLLANDIIGEIEIWGVERFEERNVVVRSRIRTRPIRQWDVGREFNRRLKMRCDEVGIEMSPPRRVQLMEPQDRAAREATPLRERRA
jgi:moderate conductance mechanosensitive channel